MERTILGFRVKQSPHSWKMTKAESPYTFKFFTFLSMAACRPIKHALYSATLFVQPKFNLAVNGQYSPLGDISIAPIPRPKTLDAPSKYSFHVSLGRFIFYLENGHEVFIWKFKFHWLILIFSSICQKFCDGTSFDCLLRYVLDVILRQ